MDALAFRASATMTQYRFTTHLISQLFNVLPDVCASRTRGDWKRSESTGIFLVTAPKQIPSFRCFEMHTLLKADLLPANSFAQQQETHENH